MLLTRHLTSSGNRWAIDNKFLPASFTLNLLLDLPMHLQQDLLRAVVTSETAVEPLLAPIESYQEVWASGVTFLRSRQAREAESTTGDIYQRVYVADRPELFYKSTGWRVIGPAGAIRIRQDSNWNVPEPEMVLIMNRFGEICGFTAGNDVSSRDIEGENPLYLPQAKVYNGSCSLGPAIKLIDEPGSLNTVLISLQITRSGVLIFDAQTSTSQMKRSYQELAVFLFKELDFPSGVFLMTGTGIVPPESFTLQVDDDITIRIGDLILKNTTT